MRLPLMRRPRDLKKWPVGGRVLYRDHGPSGRGVGHRGMDLRWRSGRIDQLRGGQMRVVVAAGLWLDQRA